MLHWRVLFQEYSSVSFGNETGLDFLSGVSPGCMHCTKSTIAPPKCQCSDRFPGFLQCHLHSAGQLGHCFHCLCPTLSPQASRVPLPLYEGQNKARCVLRGGLSETGFLRKMLS